MTSPEEERPLLILYGSQTGCAQEVAERLHRDASRRMLAPRTMAMDAYDRRRLAGEALVIFVASTTGDGECPDNMRSFWRFLLRKALPRDALAAVRFAVFGMGDSSYAKFNATARKLDARLGQLGGQRFMPPGGADDQSPKGALFDVDTWATKLWRNILALPGYELPVSFIVDDRPRLPVLGFDVRCRGPTPRSSSNSNSNSDSSSSSGPRDRPLTGADHAVDTTEAAGAATAASSTSVREAAVSAEVSVSAAAGALRDHLGPLPRGAYEVERGTDRPSAECLRKGRQGLVATVVASKRLTALPWTQDVRHVEFDLSPHCAVAVHDKAKDGEGDGRGGDAHSMERAPLRYEAGDIAIVYPHNRWRDSGSSTTDALCHDEEGGRGCGDTKMRGAGVGVQTEAAANDEAIAADGGDGGAGSAHGGAHGGARDTEHELESLKDFVALFGLDPDTEIEIVPNCEPHGRTDDATTDAAVGGFSDEAAKRARVAKDGPGHGSAILVGGCHMVPAPDLPSPCSARMLFTCFLDVLGKPKRHFLEVLSLFAEDDEQREKLLELSSAEGADLYHDYVYRERRSYVEVLREFDSTRGRVPLSFLLAMVPRIAPREFSISSSPRYHGTHRVHLTVAVVRAVTPYRRERFGLASSYIASLRPGDQVVMRVKRGLMRVPMLPPQPLASSRPSPSSVSSLPAQLKQPPLILVGPGTGGAPLRSIIYERLAVATAAGDSSQNICEAATLSDDSRSCAAGIASVVLFFGCRRESMDYLYRDEWEWLQARHDLRVVTAFSRDQESKVYVQDRLVEDGVGQKIWASLANQGGYCFVAGNSKVPGAVRAALADVAKRCGGLDDVRAEAFVKRLEVKGRLVIESWS